MFTIEKKKAKITDYFVCAVLITFFFVPIYYGMDIFTSNRSHIYKFYFNWEKNLPYISGFYIVYYSVFILPVISFFLINNTGRLYNFTANIIFAIIFSAIIYYFFPSQIGYNNHGYDEIKDVSEVVTGKYNLLPSLHVLLVLLYLREFNMILKNKYLYLTVIYFILVILSTLFTHQHHIVDVFASLLVGFFWGKIPFEKLFNEKSSTPTSY